MPQVVEDILRLQFDKLQAFDRLLVTEHACLLQAAVDQLPALSEQKTALIAEIESIEQDRINAFHQDVNASSSPAWASVQRLAKQVSDANQRNGSMIMALMRNTEGALQILRGTTGEVDLYGAHGQGQAGSAAARLQVSA